MQPPESPDLAHLWDMRSALRTIESYVAQVGESGFRTYGMAQDAIIRQLTVPGEAAARVSMATRTTHAQVPWKRVVGLRNVVVHQYDKVSLDELWESSLATAPGS
jgi:uncharacterized protein with HEPN domain